MHPAAKDARARRVPKRSKRFIAFTFYLILRISNRSETPTGKNRENLPIILIIPQ